MDTTSPDPDTPPLEITICLDAPSHENMAIDKAMMNAAHPVLRLYTWTPPAITLGCSQTEAVLDMEACRAEGIVVVKRFTGGAAVLHKDDLTYAFFWPATCRPAYRPIDIRERFRHVFLQSFADLGISAEACNNARWQMPETAICFHGQAANEVAIGGRKVAGNAQRLTRRGIFQHGSILLENTEPLFCRLMRAGAPQGVMTGLREHNPSVTAAELASRMAQHASEVFDPST